MDLLHKQFIFAGLFARLILYAFQQGRKVKILQVLRSKEEAARLAALGLGIVDSIHCDGIAGDLAIISDDDVEVSDTSQYQFLGEFWESLSDPDKGITCAWGGRFQRQDGGHFSIEHNGVR